MLWEYTDLGPTPRTVGQQIVSNQGAIRYHCRQPQVTFWSDHFTPNVHFLRSYARNLFSREHQLLQTRNPITRKLHAWWKIINEWHNFSHPILFFFVIPFTNFFRWFIVKGWLLIKIDVAIYPKQLLNLWIYFPL